MKDVITVDNLANLLTDGVVAKADAAVDGHWKA